MILVFWVVGAMKGRVGVKEKLQKQLQSTPVNNLVTHTRCKLGATWQISQRAGALRGPLMACTTQARRGGAGWGVSDINVHKAILQLNFSSSFLLSYHITSIYSFNVFSHCKTDITPSKNSISVATTAENDQAVAHSTFQSHQSSPHFS